MISKIWVVIMGLLLSFTVNASPTIDHWQTANGGQVYYVYTPELPMVDVQVIFDAGAARDGDLNGVSLLTNALLNEGAAGMTADQVAAAFDDVGAQFGNTSQRDMAVLTMRSLIADNALKPALDVFGKVLAQPDFPQASFQRIQKQLLLSLQAENQSPAAIASRRFYYELYPEHPYGTMPSGQVDTVSAITVDDLKRFYKQYYVAQNAVVVIVGALDKSQASDVANELLGQLPEGDKAEQLAKVEPLHSAQTIHIDFPSTQTHIVMGQPGMSRDDDDYFALYIGNHILGGSGLVSQLSNEIREKRGLSYSVYSYFRPMQELGPFQLALQTRNDQAQQALDVMKNTLTSFIKNGPTDDELLAAKQNISGGFALRVDSNKKIADYLAMIGFYGLPLDYLDNFIDKVNAVTKQQIKEAFNRRVKPDKMITILVGGEAETK
ncbi:MAG: insulinase family protein [Gammaproteobacteria bacterium]|nr:insulinase family protein [Gammaproteobacteria bacterium]